jgi:hypothetical protein
MRNLDIDVAIDPPESSVMFAALGGVSGSMPMSSSGRQRPLQIDRRQRPGRDHAQRRRQTLRQDVDRHLRRRLE